MSIDLVRMGTMLFFVTPSAVKLFIWRADCGCVQPIFMIFWWRGNICLAVMKRAASSDFATEDMTNLMIWAIVSSGTLLAGMGTSLDRKM